MPKEPGSSPKWLDIHTPNQANATYTVTAVIPDEDLPIISYDQYDPPSYEETLKMEEGKIVKEGQPTVADTHTSTVVETNVKQMSILMPLNDVHPFQILIIHFNKATMDYVHDFMPASIINFWNYNLSFKRLSRYPELNKLF